MGECRSDGVGPRTRGHPKAETPRAESEPGGRGAADWTTEDRRTAEGGVAPSNSNDGGQTTTQPHQAGETPVCWADRASINPGGPKRSSPTAHIRHPTENHSQESAGA